MKPPRTTVREARRSFSKILAEGKTITIGDGWNTARGFLVGIPPYDSWNQAAKRKALKEAKARFTAAWITESQQ